MKWLFILLFGFLSISLVSAVCQTNNDFENDDNFNICSGRCKYEITAGNYVDCNSSVQCYLTMSYPNTTILDFFKEMEFNHSGSEVYNYSFGDASDFPEGLYAGQINCYWDEGWSDPINFQTGISYISSSYFGTGDPISDYIKPAIKEIEKTFWEKLFEKKWLFIVYLGIFVLIVVVVYDYKKFKFKKLVKRVKKELKKT